MTPNRTDQVTCDVCNQPFNSERELQEHNRTAHSQEKQGKHSPSDRPQGRQEPSEPGRERIA
jgi:hypothetical protein